MNPANKKMPMNKQDTPKNILIYMLNFLDVLIKLKFRISKFLFILRKGRLRGRVKSKVFEKNLFSSSRSSFYEIFKKGGFLHGHSGVGDFEKSMRNLM